MNGMNILRLLTVGMMVCVLTVSTRADNKKEKSDNAKLLVGKWEATSDDKELTVGTVIEFGKDGKMKITAKEWKGRSLGAVYKVEGDKIQYTLKLSYKDEKKDPLIIKKISEQELVLVLESKSKKSATFEFKRIK